MVKNNTKEKKAAKPGFFERISSVQADSHKETPVKFTYFAPRAISVSVAGSFNNWTPGSFRLEIDRAGQWCGTMMLKPGTYQYRFFVNGQWTDDPHAKKTVPNEFGAKNAVLEVK